MIKLKVLKFDDDDDDDDQEDSTNEQTLITKMNKNPDKQKIQIQKI